MRDRPQRYDQVEELKQRLISGLATCLLIGSYDDVAERIQQLSDAGLDGMAVGLINYIMEMPHVRDGVFPRLERLGLRVPLRDMAEA